ncbi:MAG: radical SAM peptide maturase, CXXX-repeat target family [Chlorobiaceae bacterium]|nr:radical SAM peptide maturase, CXXX-repeat target family [Chlorobiaceae bacterium]
MCASVARPPVVWQQSKAKTVTFMVTEDCQLRCRYCYFTGKNSHSAMSFEVARKVVDYLTENRELFSEPSIVWDFIGGEPLLEIRLIDEICNYIKVRQQEKHHPWGASYRFSITTNGILYANPAVQRYITKNHKNLSIGLTLDGTPQKHDLNRVYPSEKGSYADIVKNIPLWLKQFPDASTKVTVSSDDLPFVAESVLHLHDLGIRHVSINVVFEDAWKEGDDQLFEEQLITLADAFIDQELFRQCTCSFFSETIGYPRMDNNNWCGAGRMLAVDSEGNFYPCHRFTPPSLSRKKAISVGNCFDGINLNRLRPFLSLDLRSQSTAECVECPVASGCAWCQGANYDYAETQTIFRRATNLCSMHKARVRANNYYRNRLDRILHA